MTGTVPEVYYILN